MSATARHARLVTPSSYTVRPGDTLSAIAAREYGSPALYPALWWVNKAVVHDPNVVAAGLVLVLSGWHPQTPWLAAAAKKADPPVAYTVAYRPRHVVQHAARRAVAIGGGHHDQWDGKHYGTPGNECGDGDGDGLGDMPCSMLHHAAVRITYRAPARRAAPAARSSSSGATYHGSSSVQQCIIRAESGGNSQVMNGTGHYGLYQFAQQTWVANGGSAASFGHASVAEQNQVFANTVARSGYSAWTPYDGC